MKVIDIIYYKKLNCKMNQSLYGLKLNLDVLLFLLSNLTFKLI